FFSCTPRRRAAPDPLHTLCEVLFPMAVSTSAPPETLAKGARAKRPSSPARQAAARANGKRGRGPITEAGKAAAARNSVTPGGTCPALIFLPGESEAEFHAQVDRWARELKVFTSAEYAEVQSAVYQQWKIARIRGASATAATQKIEHLEDEARDRRAAEVEEL